MNRIAAGAVAAAVSVATACSNHVAHVPEPTATVSLGGAPSVPMDVPNDVAARRHVSIGGCAGDADSWHAQGIASNATAAAVTYEVTVFFTTLHATVLSSATTKIVAPAHKQATWSTGSRFRTGGQVRCVLRGVAVVH